MKRRKRFSILLGKPQSEQALATTRIHVVGQLEYTSIACAQRLVVERTGRH
jgi:hypothetical protein